MTVMDVIVTDGAGTSFEEKLEYVSRKEFVSLGEGAFQKRYPDAILYEGKDNIM
jgi:hypothetical protein